MPAGQNGMESTDIGSQSAMHHIKETTEAVTTTTAAEPFGCDCNSETKATPDVVTSEGLLAVSESHTVEEEKECAETNNTDCSQTDAKEQNGISDSSNRTTSSNTREESENSVVNASITGDGSELEELKMDENVDLELKLATSLEIEKNEAESCDASIDSTPMSPLAGTNSAMNAKTREQEKIEMPPSFDRIIPPSQSTIKELKGESFNSAAAFYERKRILRSKRTDHQRTASMVLTSLPIDSLHSIASFLTPMEWKSFGQCNKATNKVGREIFRRVRMHGFRCATEVVIAWKFGQHADAKELCALYVNSGVPIYPHSLGHSYHTLIWRLSVEAKHLEEKERKRQVDSKITPSSRTFGKSTSNVDDRYPTDPSAVTLGFVDAFYNERDPFRRRENLVDGLGEGDLTYLEEKSLFNLKSDESKIGLFTGSHRRRSSIDQAHRRARNPIPGALPQAPPIPPPLPLGVPGAEVTRNSWVANSGTGQGAAFRRAYARSHSFSGNSYRTPKVTLKVHRHLLDQHLLGRSAVNDVEGAMTTPTVSLSADFFHPFFALRHSEDTTRKLTDRLQNSGSPVSASDGLLQVYNQLPVATMQQMDERIADPMLTARMVDDSDSDAESEMVFPTFLMEPPHPDHGNEMMAAGTNIQPRAFGQHTPSNDARHHHRRRTFTSTGISSGAPSRVAADNGILSNIDLEVYSASSRSEKSDRSDTKERQLKKYLTARFTVYQCCLERHLLNNDSEGFEETILDFWDEFFPQTVNIHYYDLNTAVPRISRLEKFLTRPCPKQIGIVQCEIERVKLNSKKKGVNMKGRFFPTYEYRLFIRHHPDPTYDDNDSVRRDTVLMTAKNRGRKYPDNTTQTSKKGSNNYYLRLPQQDDLDLHFKSANEIQDQVKNVQNGIGTHTDSSRFSGLLGRLQSNFVGTEFQIFTPRVAKEGSKSQFLSSPMSTPSGIISRASSDDSVLFESGRQSELGSFSSDRRRSRFGRRSLRRRSSGNGTESPLHLRRSRSSDATPGRNRKVSAAESFFESQQFKSEPEYIISEEEDGAITYTANLLGSRPRIMDVCIPKVNPNDTVMEWRRYLENCKDQEVVSSADRLLNHLKQLQQNGQTEDNGMPTNSANNNEEQTGADEQPHSSPSDHGLLALQNRPPWWNVELGSFVLNFGGRVSVASVKNFQLCDRNEQDHIMLQFGRIEGRHSFTMDFQYPLTAVQAFAIAISSLQSKMSFG